MQETRLSMIEGKIDEISIKIDKIFNSNNADTATEFKKLELIIQQQEANNRWLELQIELTKLNSKHTINQPQFTHNLSESDNKTPISNLDNLNLADRPQLVNARIWITQNSPNHMKSTISYYDNYKKDNPHPVNIDEFNRCVEDHGYKILKLNHRYVWVSTD
jgi:hypothetical protein